MRTSYPSKSIATTDIILGKGTIANSEYLGVMGGFYIFESQYIGQLSSSEYYLQFLRYGPRSDHLLTFSLYEIVSQRFSKT